MGPSAHLLLDVVLMPDIAQVEPDLSELLDFGRCKACFYVFWNTRSEPLRVIAVQ